MIQARLKLEIIIGYLIKKNQHYPAKFNTYE